MSGVLEKYPGLVWLGFAAAAAMLIGSFGPWGKVIGLLNVSISGTDGQNDGWIVVGAALLGAAALFGWSQGKGRWLAAVTLLSGLAGVGTTYYDRSNLTSLESGTDLARIQVGWGLNLALGASLVLGVVGLVALFEKQAAPEMATPPPTPSA